MVRRPRFSVNALNEQAFTSVAHNDIQASNLIAVGEERPPEKNAELWAEWVLSASIRQCGILIPVLYYRGELLDGSRRETLSRSIGCACPRLDLTSETQAARLLWRVHPARAWRRWVRPAMRRELIADLFGVDTAELPDRRVSWLRESKRDAK